MAVRIEGGNVLLFVASILLWIHVVIDGATALQCWQCSWNIDKEESEKLVPIDVDVSKPKPSKQPEEDVIENPSVKPFYGKDTWPNYPKNEELALRCENCTIEGGICLKWIFRISDSIQNFTRMCARSSGESGCYTQDMGHRWVKEVCLCREDNCNGNPTIMGSGMMCFLTLVWLIVFAPT